MSKDSEAKLGEDIRGEDIEVDLRITQQEAAAGISKEVSVSRLVNLNGVRQQKTKKFTLRVPPGSRNDTRLRLKSQGHESLYGGSPGHVYVRLLVDDVKASSWSTPKPKNQDWRHMNTLKSIKKISYQGFVVRDVVETGSGYRVTATNGNTKLELKVRSLKEVENELVRKVTSHFGGWGWL